VLVCVYQRRGQSHQIKDFLLSIRQYQDGCPPKKDRVWLQGCIVLGKEHEEFGSHLGNIRHSAGGRKPTMGEGRTANRNLFRRRTTQGRPYKCPVIRELLWDWFVDVRRSIASTVSPKFMLMKARSISEEILKVQRATGMYSSMPKLDKHWLLRWKRDKGVVFRKPNVRFKCSKAVMTARLRAMWVNSIKVRRLSQKLLGKDLTDQMYGIDEKPLHFNESGSKNLRTLEIAGAPSVKLKQNHSATRERVSVMTFTTSNLAVIQQPKGLPVSRDSNSPLWCWIPSEHTLGKHFRSPHRHSIF
jgi:hypothetical protein